MKKGESYLRPPFMIQDHFSTDESVENVITNLDQRMVFSGQSSSPYVKRNIVLEECSFVEKFLKCIICEEIYNHDDRQPKLLPCHHTLCRICIIQMFISEAEYRRSLIDDLPNAVTIICPQCSKSFISTQEGLRQLPTDHRVVQLLDFFSNTDRHTVQYCYIHETQPINFFCESCIKPICRDCTILDHTEAKGHKVRDLDGALKHYTPIIEAAMSDLQSEKSSLKEKRETLEQSIETFDKAEQDVVEQVRGSFAALRAALEEREKQLIAMAEKEVGNEKQKFREKIDLIDKRTEEVGEKYQELQKLKEEGNVEKMYKVTQNISDYKPPSSLRIREIDDGIITKFTFNDRDEKYISNRLQNYGDIITRMESSRSSVSSISSTSTTSSTSSSYTPYRYSYYRP
ncbi:TRIM2_3 [Mytilus coruscus]|uniref:TRIM2_3 n=1 Tax=Mytilus coruscus TaxID=42192 RepID=A0A6J8ACK2_MYTCO|nr:TRIM2_3 [Mytilus coruscus]